MENVVQDHDADFYLSHSPEEDNEGDIELFKEIYNPVAVCNDPIPDKGPEFDLDQYPVYSSRIKRRHIVSMHYNRKRVFELMKASGKEYDCIVSYRLDLFSRSKIDYTKLDRESIYIPEGQDHYGGINDQVAYGIYKPMSIYMSLFDSIKQYLENNICTLHSELLNRCHLFENKVPIIRTQFKYEIVRSHSLWI